jgi:hypothetical protein
MEEIPMKRIAFAAAAALLGTGCISSSSPPPPPPQVTGDVALFWQFRDYDGHVAGDFGVTDSGCGTAGVTDVDVAVYRGAARVLFENFTCEGGGYPSALVTLPVGDYTYSITAYRLADPVFYGEGSVTAMEGMRMDGYTTLDVYDTVLPLTLYYTLNGNFTCGGTSTIYLRMWTDATRTISVANADVPCGSPYGFTLPSNEPVGTYYVEWFQAIDAGNVARYERCNLNVRHAGFPTTVDLGTAPDASCPL